MYKIGSETTCLQCGKVIYGRKDKKFCNLVCKNGYHNSEAERTRKFRKRTDESLSVNYEILEGALKSGRTELDLEETVALGYRPELATFFKKRYRYPELGCYDLRYSQSDSRIYNIHRIGLDNDGYEL